MINLKQRSLTRRAFARKLSWFSLGALAPLHSVRAEVFLSLEQAKQILMPGKKLAAMEVKLSQPQMVQIEKLSQVRVRSNRLSAWKSDDNEWLIVDHVIGKHENIDIAVTLSNQGKVNQVEVLTYRESYGDEIRHPKWRAQFVGKDHSQHLKLDRDIANISGATLSCRHVTDGINRLTQTWKVVLQHI